MAADSLLCDCGNAAPAKLSKGAISSNPFRAALRSLPRLHLIFILPPGTLCGMSRPEDLVFQSVRTGAPMRDNNILSRHIKPAGRANSVCPGLTGVVCA